MNDILKAVIPTVAGFLGGPGASLAAEWLAGKLGMSDKTIEGVQNTLAGMSAADLVKVKEIEADLTKHMADNGIALDLAQVEVNKEESKSQFLFVAGWRPYIGWISGTSLGYQFLIRPLLNGILHVFGVTGDPFPALEIQDLFALVTTMLGHSALRSWDKKNATENGA